MILIRRRMSKEIKTDTWTFIKFWAIPGIAYLLYLFVGKAIEGLIIVGVAALLALALKPLVRKVNRFLSKLFGEDKKHQTLSAFFAYLIVILVIGTILAIVGPVVVSETARFIQNFPETFETTFGGWEGVNNLGRSMGIENLQHEITTALHNISNDILGVLGNNLISSVSGLASIIMQIVLTLVLTLLFLLDGPAMVESLWNKLGAKDKNNKTVTVSKRVVAKMANVVSIYFSRQVLVAMLDGLAAMLMTFVLSLIFNFSSGLAVPMGMITMVFYLIPMFGQFIGGTLVTLILFFSSPIAGLSFAVIYILYSQIENNIISPKIQGDALHLTPLVILCAITVGMYMFGLLGAIIAIPIAGCIRVLVDEYPNIKASRNDNN